MSLYKISKRSVLARSVYKISIRGPLARLLKRSLCKRSLQKIYLRDLKVRSLCKLSKHYLRGRSLLSSPGLCTRNLSEVSWQDLCTRALYISSLCVCTDLCKRSLGKIFAQSSLYRGPCVLARSLDKLPLGKISVKDDLFCASLHNGNAPGHIIHAIL